MALKRFRPALEDCQVAASIQAASPSAKTLLRLARCQLAVGSTTAASSTIRSTLAIEPKNAQAILLRDKVQLLENHVKNFEAARQKREWGLARLALDKCVQAIEGETPPEWRYCEGGTCIVQRRLGRCRRLAAKYVPLILTPATDFQHPSAMLCD